MGRPYPMPAPVGGWNARDALEAMPPADAVRLKNWFPRQSNVITRPGFSEHADTEASGATVEQLIPYEFAGTSKMLGCANDTIYDVTTSTVSTIAGSLSNAKWSHDYLAGYVLMANGADGVKTYNGTTFADASFTGVTLADINHVHVHQSRVYLVEKDSQSMWYGGTGAVAGALTEFDFSTVAALRGNLIATTALKGDGGDGGTDDIFLAIFAGGDVLAYTGSNPSDPTNWQKLGKYKIGRPLSRLAIAKLDDDVYIVTNRGFEKMSELAKYGRSAPEKLLLSAKIQQAVSHDIEMVGADDGWRIFVYPKGQMLIITAPLTGSARRYYVRNINTGAWCEFGDFLAYSWAELGGNCYFGGAAGAVYAFDDGSLTDNGATIRCDCQQAWSHLGRPGQEKSVSLIMPVVSGLIRPAMSVNVGADFDLITLAQFDQQGTSNTAVWDQAIWDQAIWSAEKRTFKRWYGRNALGEMIGLRLVVDVSSDRLEWNRTRMIVKVGGMV